MLVAAGWAVERVPPGQLHEEYRDGEYRVLRATRRDAGGSSGGVAGGGAAADELGS